MGSRQLGSGAEGSFCNRLLTDGYRLLYWGVGPGFFDETGAIR